jgi:hypothetical protein
MSKVTSYFLGTMKPRLHLMLLTTFDSPILNYIEMVRSCVTIITKKQRP